MKNASTKAFLVPGMALLLLAGVHADPAKLDLALRQIGPSTAGVQRVIVQFRKPPTLGESIHLKRRGIGLGRPLGDGRTCTAEVTPASLGSLVADNNVIRISLDAMVRANLDVTERAVLDPSAAWENSFAHTMGYDGTGATVALIDSGVSNSYAWKSHIARFVQVSDAGISVGSGASSVDDYGHGTHIAGMLVGSAGKDLGEAYGGMRGIAPAARLVAVKVLDENGAGYASHVIAAIDWCVAHKDELRIRVINLSLSHPPYESYTTDPLCQAVERAWKAGITVVCSAGNGGRDGYGTIGVPGNDPYVITVGAVNTYGTAGRADDAITTYSSRGPACPDMVLKPDLLAPGNRILSWSSPGSTLDRAAGFARAGWDEVSGRRPLIELSGTSMAAPVVSGLALLMYQQDARVTPDQVKMRLEATAEHWPGDLLGAGAGYVNATRALQWRLDGAVAAVSPTVVDNGDGTFHLAGTLTGTSVLWSDEFLYGDIVLWGDPSRRSSSVLWGDSVLWGNAADWAARVYGPDTGGNIVWGDVFRRQTSVLWGDAGPAADSAWPVEGSSILAYGD